MLMTFQSFMDLKVAVGGGLQAVATTYVLYFLGRYAEAHRMFELADPVIDTVEGLHPFVVYHAIKGLTIVQLLRGRIAVDGSDQAKLEAGLQSAAAVLAKGAAASPINFEGLRLLLEAEALSLRGDPASCLTIVQLYDQAIEHAASNQLLNLHALACQLTGAFYLRNKAGRIGNRFLDDAMALYEKWGATAVLRRLQYSRANSSDGQLLCAPSGEDDDAGMEFLVTPALTQPAAGKSDAAWLSNAVDFDATIKFCQVLSRQHSVLHIRSQFTRIVAECSGATHAAVVIAGEDSPLSPTSTGSVRTVYSASGKVAHIRTSISSSTVSDRDSYDASSHASDSASRQPVLDEYPRSVIQTAFSSKDVVFVENVDESEFNSDSYVASRKPKVSCSDCCM